MKKQIAVRVLRTVPVSDDGIRTREIVAGTNDFIPEDTAPGLVKEGYVEVDDAPPAPTPSTPITEPTAPLAPPAPTVDLSAMTKAELLAFAGEKEIDISAAKNKAEAVALIEAGLAAKAT